MNMQFSENPKNKYFFSQPHQPFFVLAFINSIVTMVVFLLSTKGILFLALTPTNFHVYGLVYLMFTPAFFGFLFTTFPKFASTQIIEKKQYMRIFSLLYLGAILFLLGSIVSPFLSAISMIIVFSAHVMGILILKNIYTTTTMEDRHDIFWILIAMSFGLLSHFLFIVAQIFYMPLMDLANDLSIYLYLFLVTFSVAQRMVPFFSHCMVEKDQKLLKIVFSLLLFHVVVENIYPNSSFIADLGLAYVIGKEVLSWKLPFPNPNPLLWILHIALFWIPVGFFLGALTNFMELFTGMHFLAFDTHIIMLGFVFTMMIGFGTRVTLGHSGNTMQADKWTTLIFYWTQVVVAIRILVSLASAFGWNIMVLFDITVTAWILMFILWGVRFLMVLINGKKLTP